MNQTGRCFAAQLLIDGKFVPSKSGKTFKTINPVVGPHRRLPPSNMLNVFPLPRHTVSDESNQTT